MTNIYAIFDQASLGASLELEQSGTVLLVNDVADINRTALALQPKTTGRWYAELLVYGADDLLASIGIATPTASLSTYVGGDANGWGYRMDLGQIHHNGSSVATVADGAVGDVIGVLLDMTATQPTVTWYRNGAKLYSANLASTGPWLLAASLGDAGTGSPAVAAGMRCFLNAGQRAFAYMPNELGWYEPVPAVAGIQLASEDWLTASDDDVPNNRYAGMVAGDNNELRAVRSLDFWPWQRGVKTGAMVLTTLNDGSFDELLTGDARDVAIQIASVGSDQGYADRVSLFAAVVDDVSAADDLTIKITCRDPLALMDVAVQRMMQRPDADVAAANQPVPIVLGACRNVPTVLTDAPGLIYNVTDAPVLGIGYVRDSGYPLNPAAAPPDFVLDAQKTSLVLHAEPTGKVTADISSVGGDQLPDPSDDILDGNGAPFTGSDGDDPAGFTGAGDNPPKMQGGVLEFPVDAASPTIKIQARLNLTGFTGSGEVAFARISWLDAGGAEIALSDATHLSGTTGWVTSTVTADAPAGAVRGRVEVAVYLNVTGTVYVDNIQGWYVMPDTSLVEIAFDNGNFEGGDTGWSKEAGWSILTDGAHAETGSGYAKHGPAGTIFDDAATAALRNNVAADISVGALNLGWLPLTSVKKYGSGKSYKVVITIPTLPAGLAAIALATGTTIASIIAEWTAAGTYTLTITNSDGVDHDLYLLGVPLAPGTVPTPPTVSSIQIIEYDDTYNPDPISLVPATLQSIPLADYVAQILDVRAARLGMAWSLADVQAIDTASGYAGVGVYLAGGETVAQALDLALASYTACKWVDAEGTVRFTRLIAPDSVDEGDRAGTLDINAMGGDLVPVMDQAPGLTTQMGVRRNWAQLSDGDLVEPTTNFPLAVRNSMLRTYQTIVSTAQPLAGAYRHAQYATVQPSCFDQAADGQAEVDRVAAIYAVPRWFYAVAVELDALAGMDLGQVWTLAYGRYGLSAGKPVMVIDFEPDLLAGTANVILWG